MEDALPNSERGESGFKDKNSTDTDLGAGVSLEYAPPV